MSLSCPDERKKVCPTRPRAGTPGDAGIDPHRLASAYGLMDRWICEGRIGGGVIALSRHGVVLPPRAFGRRRWQGGERPMAVDDVFLVASVTKPVTAAMLMHVVSTGAAGLLDRLIDHLPAFRGPVREQVRLLHLLTHTSGMPDMLPNNRALRAQHAPLSAFVDGSCAAQLLFKPGSRVSYQSMGTLLAGEIASRLAAAPLPQMMQEQIFTPAGMDSTVLGYRPEFDERVVAVELSPATELETDWHWNSPYWRHLGAPWGGMHSSAEDLLRWLHLFLARGRQQDTQILSAGVCDAMIRDHTAQVGNLNSEDRRHRRWGLGWRLGTWGDLASPDSFSHGGATGTLIGADPRSGLAGVILTTRPGAPLDRLATAIQAAVLP